MNYRDKFTASEEKAHRRIIATKIDREMREQRSLVESSPTARRRWVWELIQNAKDVHQNGAVKISIEFNSIDPVVVFRHSGKPFSAENIRFLIEQVSSKERTMDDCGLPTTTGKFGTGFLATHLLSESVTVQGVAKEPDLDFKQFQFELDRSGEDLETIADAVEKAKQSVEQLDGFPTYGEYDANSLNTAFHYPLADGIAFAVAQAGIDDIAGCLPYVLGFVPVIESVDVPDQSRLYRKKWDRPSTLSPLPNGATLIVTEVSLAKRVAPEENEETFHFLRLSIGHTTIAMPIMLNENGVYFKSVSEGIPRLFCDFPLVGTEVFPFPAVINNPNFDPTDPRDGVFLTGRERITPQAANNREIMANAVALFLQLIDVSIGKSWNNLYHLAEVAPLSLDLKWVEREWYAENVLGPIREKILFAPIVETASGSRTSMITSEGNLGILFPKAKSKELRQQIWTLANFWFPYLLPKFDQIEIWQKIVWDKCGRLTTDQFAVYVEAKGTIEELSGSLRQIEGIDWLNDFYTLLESEGDHFDSIINTRAIFPNQNGCLRRLDFLARDEGDIGEEFKDILALLGEDIREDLIDTNIAIASRMAKTIGRKDVVEKISSLVMNIVNDREEARRYQPALRELLSWFRNNMSLAQALFPHIYSNKHLLYDEETVINSMDKADQLDQLLLETGATTVDQLKRLISDNGTDKRRDLLPVSQEILASLGIATLEDWQKAMEDKDLASMFSHESTPTVEMLDYAQNLIEVAKNRIIAHLRTLSIYDLTNVEQTAPTILAGITKDGREIQIVARPGASGKVIIYYSAERDTLDYVDSELWVDTGDAPLRVTLGHILKTTGIKKFPI